MEHEVESIEAISVSVIFARNPHAQPSLVRLPWSPEISHASGETVLGLRSEYREVAGRISSHVLGQRWAL
jgi:hypothetical protein